MHTNIRKYTGTAALCLTLAAGAATAARAADAYDATKDQADADYKVASQKCDALSGNDRDVCLQRAKANMKETKANAKASQKAGEANTDARNEKMEQEYKVAKEKCDALSGDAKDACIERAKTKYNQ